LLIQAKRFRAHGCNEKDCTSIENSTGRIILTLIITTLTMKKILILSCFLTILISSCNKGDSDNFKIVDPKLNCNINNSAVSFPIQKFAEGPNVHLDTKYLPGVIVISNFTHFEGNATIGINIQKRFDINSLENSTSLIETESHGDTIQSVACLNTIYNLSDNEFGSLFKTGNLNIVKNAGSYESYDEDGVVLYYSTNKGTYFSTDFLLTGENNATPYFQIERVEYLNNFRYKNSNEAVDPSSNRAYYVKAKFSLKFVDKVHSDTILIKDANVEFVTYNYHYIKN